MKFFAVFFGFLILSGHGLADTLNNTRFNLVIGRENSAETGSDNYYRIFPLTATGMFVTGACQPSTALWSYMQGTFGSYADNEIFDAALSAFVLEKSITVTYSRNTSDNSCVVTQIQIN